MRTQFQTIYHNFRQINKINKLKSDNDTTRALVYAGDIDKEIENNLDNSAKLFEQLLTA